MSLPLTEKYRPNKLEDLAIDNNVLDKMKEYIEQKNIPNLLFYGPPGTGKTTLARILINNLIENKRDLLALNASDDRSVQVIRDRVIPFTQTKAIASKFKIIYFEEIASDQGGLTLTAQSALLNIMEEASKTSRFIGTTNFVDKLLPALRSRFVLFKIEALPKLQIKNRIIEILNQENIEYTEKQVDKIINVCYPNMRNMLQIIDKARIKNKLNDSLIEQTLFEIYYIDKYELVKNFVIYLWQNRHINNNTFKYLPSLIKDLTEIDLTRLAEYLDIKYTEMDLLELLVDMKRNNNYDPKVIDVITEIINSYKNSYS